MNGRKMSIWDRIKASDGAQCYILLALPLIGFFVFTLYPIIWSAAKAFYYYDMIPSNTRFVGFGNFITLFQKGTDYWRGWLVTFQYMIIKLPIEISLALILAMLLFRGLKGSNAFRNLYFLPSVISVAIVGVIFTNIFDVFGLANDILLKLGWISAPMDWFSKKSTAMAVLLIGGIWTGLGTNVIYLTAALSNVPKDLYEAAEVEGANPVQKFFKITLPMISKVFQVILLLAINGTLRTGEYIIVMTNGAPAGKTLTAEAYIIRAFLPGFAANQNMDLGYGCAISIISSLICALVGVTYMRMTKRISDLY